MNRLNLKLNTSMFLFCAILLSPAKNTHAEEQEDKAPENEASVCNKLNGESEAWYDDAHTYLSIQFCEPSVWFDSFFSDERIDEEVRAGTRVRWQNDYVLTEGGTWGFKSNLNASFKLPNIKKSINLVFEGDDEEDLANVVPGAGDEDKNNVGLLYEVTESERVNFSVRVKLSPSISFRYRYTWPRSESFKIRFTQAWFRRDNADGTISRIDFEKKLDEKFFLRQSNSVEHSENFDGKEWTSSLVLYQHLTDKSALSYESSMAGVTEPERYTKNRRLGMRYRQNVYRKWLFYEIAPAVNWSKPLPTDDREAAWEVLFRLEVNFVNL